MDKIYRLDLLTLIKSLDQQSAQLKAELEPGTVPGVFEDCVGHVRIRRGEIVKCSIIGKSGPQVSGPGALQYLRTVDRWLVSLEQDEEPPPQPLIPAFFPPPQSSPSRLTQQFPFSMGEQTYPSLQPPQFAPLPPSVVFPRQRAPLPGSFLEKLSHRDRMVFRIVFAMVNGQRSIDQIKEQLLLSEETVDRVLNDLRAMRIIEW